MTKSHYAQLIGAQMVLIADNKEEDEDYVILVDDGLGKRKFKKIGGKKR